METNPNTLSAEPLTSSQIPEVSQALTLTDSYVDSGTAKLAQIASIVGGESATKYGFTNDNIKKVMMFVGAYTSLKFLYDRGFKYKFQILGTAMAVYALRTYYADKEAKKELPLNQADTKNAQSA